MEKNPLLYPGNEDRHIADLYYVKSENVFKKKLINEKLHICGIDEVGRGSLAGHLVTVGAVLPENIQEVIPELPVDSKQLTEEKVSELATRIREHALMIHLVYTGPQGVNKKGVQKATHYNLKKIVQFVRSSMPDIRIQVDGNQGLKGQKLELIPKGDATQVNISAASILAKDFSNRIMQIAHDIYPQYNFLKHKGYSTADHQKLIKQHGIGPFHREHTSKKLERRRDKKDTANLSPSEIKEYLALSLFYMNRKSEVANSWERNFVTECILMVKSEKHISPKMQFYIQKTYKNIKKKAKIDSGNVDSIVKIVFEKMHFFQPKHVDVVDIRDMFALIIPSMQQNTHIVTSEEKTFLIESLTQLKQGQSLSQENVLFLREIYGNVKQKQSLTA